MKKWRQTGAVALLTILAFTGCGGGGETPPESLPKREVLTLAGYETLGKGKEAYVDSTFYSDLDDEVTFACNAMWDLFGLASTGAVARTGSNSSWLYWDAAKWLWSSDKTRETVKGVVRSYAQRADGFLWSWGDSETWGGAGYNNTDTSYTAVYHYDQMFNYINAVREICVWDNSTAFLDEKDTTTARTEYEVNGIEYRYEDVSQGMTVLEKTEAAMRFILEELGGKDGLIVLGGDNTGEFNSASSNYWDNLSFGHQDPYEGMLFLGALGSMADLYRMRGETAKEQEYRTLLAAAKAAYEQTYWSADKGRYLSTVTESGEKLDYGLTFLNTEALYYGAGGQQNADKIFSWIDGERIVEGDTAQGLEILDQWTIAPMSNTVPIESLKKYDETVRRNITWWHAPGAINVFTNSKFQLHCENGGAIFYTTYFELMSRFRYGKTDSALQRLIAIAREYGKDELLRDPSNSYGSAWILGVIGEFPESGLVPTTFLRGLMGVNATARGLEIAPNIPAEYGTLGAKGVQYGGKVYNVEIERGKKVTLSAQDEGEAALRLVFADFAGKGGYTVKVDGAAVPVVKNADGTFSVQTTLSGRATVTVE